MFYTLDEELLPLVYKNQIRLNFEYGGFIWHPHYQIIMKNVDLMQRRTTKRQTIYRKMSQLKMLLSGIQKKMRNNKLHTYNILIIIFRHFQGKTRHILEHKKV